MTKKEKNKSAARLRYEKSHPVISFRVNKELYDRLKTAKDVEGMSEADIVRIGLGILEPIRKSEKEIWQKGFNAGEESGFERAGELYEVKYNCYFCGEEMVVDTDEEKMAIKRYAREHRWSHAECQGRRNRR